MKKTFIAVLALVAIAACNKTEVIDTKAPQAISFDNPFVDNATKAIINNSSELTAFQVFGTVDGVGIFNDVTVTKTNSVWNYEDKYTQYWTAGTYNFYAVAGASAENITSSNGVPTEVVYTNSDAGQADLLYATATRTQVAGSLDTDAVPFSFKHQLAKAKFTVENGFAEESNISVSVSDITITNADENGKLTIAEKGNTWAITDAAGISLTFGDISKVEVSDKASTTTEKLLIPVTSKEYLISFKVTLYNGSVEIASETHSNVPFTVSLQMGYAYNFSMTLNKDNAVDGLVPIKFTVTEENLSWETGTSDSITVQ